MGLFTNLIGLLVVVVVVYLLYSYFFSNTSKLSGLANAKVLKTIKADTLPINPGGNHYAYSVWFYINNWDYRLTETKDILVRTGANGAMNPSITLAPYENNIDINITTYPISSASASDETTPGAGDHAAASGSAGTTHPCTIRNVPLQRWVNLVVSLNNRTLDVYLDGKLVRTCVLPGVATVDANANVSITPGGGFSGNTSNIQYFASPLNPQEAFNVYRKGPGSGNLFGFFNKYRLKVSYLVNNKEQGSLSI